MKIDINILHIFLESWLSLKTEARVKIFLDSSADKGIQICCTHNKLTLVVVVFFKLVFLNLPKNFIFVALARLGW